MWFGRFGQQLELDRQLRPNRGMQLFCTILNPAAITGRNNINLRQKAATFFSGYVNEKVQMIDAGFLFKSWLSRSFSHYCAQYHRRRRA